MSYSFLLRDTRAYYGLTQAQLATWLGVSRDLLASIETGREKLPRHAKPWLFPWLSAQNLPDTSRPDPVRSPAEAEPTAGPAAVRARLLECHYQAQSLYHKQVALLARHRTATRRLAAGPLLLAVLPTEAAAEPVPVAVRRRWLSRLLEEATDALLPEAPAGPVAALLLDARRQAYLCEAAVLQATLTGAG